MSPTRRGSLYIATLGVSTIVIVAGLSAMYVVRTRDRTAQLNREIAQASLSSRSAVDLFLQRAINNPSWRTEFTNGAWSSDETRAESQHAFKVTDESDADLNDDSSEPFRLAARATVGHAVRITSVELTELRQRVSTIAPNGDVEAGLTGWAAEGTCVLTASTDEPAEGAACLLVSGRDDESSGPSIDLGTALISDETYRIRFLVRPTMPTAKLAITLICETSDGTVTRSTTESLLTLTWAEVGLTMTPSWTGTLTSARLVIRTGDGLDFRIDNLIVEGPDASTPAQLLFTAGSWRQDVAG